VQKVAQADSCVPTPSAADRIRPGAGGRPSLAARDRADARLPYLMRKPVIERPLKGLMRQDLCQVNPQAHTRLAERVPMLLESLQIARPRRVWIDEHRPPAFQISEDGRVGKSELDLGRIEHAQRHDFMSARTEVRQRTA